MHRLGRIPSPIDTRDYLLASYIPAQKVVAIKAKAWDFPGPVLDQGNTGHCVGFSGANWGICSPINDHFINANGDQIYYAAKVIDGEPNQEDGSTVRSLAKVLKQMGRLNAYAFASSMADIKYWLLTQGPVVMGTDWYEGMFTPDKNNRIRPTGAVAGGHAFLVNEWTAGNYLGIQNSWGPSWGKNGKAYISSANFAKIFKNGGECLAAVELPV